ncbi:reverse transcriptase [Gossypium australe]|uniref:Reverse transcriptase n=1 Tax=Gossypium australe TaxID=47621 RepID=A0A5B6X9F4_9ROSI|nr:reverse transcriptase [Gossypium australe]
MALGVKIAEMGWDLSLRAQSQRALAMKSVWLREEGEGNLGGNPKDSQIKGNNLWAIENKSGLLIQFWDSIMYGFEKNGRLPRDERRMENFRNVLANCQLMDVGFSRNWFTWERGNLPETNIRERLDRGVANDEWMTMFLEVTIQHLIHSFSYHCPLLINTRMVEKWLNNRVFKFEAWWIMEGSFGEEVKNIWETSFENLLQKLDNLKEGLKRWARRSRINKRRRKEFLTARLLELKRAERDYINLVEMIDAKIQLNFEIEKDERYWNKELE